MVDLDCLIHCDRDRIHRKYKSRKTVGKMVTLWASFLFVLWCRISKSCLHNVCFNLLDPKSTPRQPEKTSIRSVLLSVQNFPSEINSMSLDQAQRSKRGAMIWFVSVFSLCSAIFSAVWTTVVQIMIWRRLLVLRRKAHAKRLIRWIDYFCAKWWNFRHIELETD